MHYIAIEKQQSVFVFCFDNMEKKDICGERMLRSWSTDSNNTNADNDTIASNDVSRNDNA